MIQKTVITTIVPYLNSGVTLNHSLLTSKALLLSLPFDSAKLMAIITKAQTQNTTPMRFINGKSGQT